MAINSSDLITPGSAVSDTVQQILERRREAQRQMMLDRLGVEKFRSDEDQRAKDYQLRQAEEARQKQLSDAQIAEAHTRQLQQQIGMLPEDEFDASDLKDNNPDLFNELVKEGRIRPETTTPKVSSSTDFQAPPDATPDQLEQYAQQLEANGPDQGAVPVGPASTRFMYTGSKEHQQEKIFQKRIDDFILNNPQYAKDKDMLNALMFMRNGLIKQIPDEFLVPNSVVPIKPGSVKSGQPINLPRGAKPMELPYPPQPNTYTAPQLWQLTDPKTNTTISKVMTPVEAQAYANAGYTLRKGNEPTQTPHDLVPAEALRPLQIALGAKGITSDQRAMAVQQAMGTIGSIARQRGASADVLSAVDHAMQDVIAAINAGRPIPTVEQLLGQVSDANPQEQQQFEALLRALITGVSVGQ
jgi:hypothetical protein